MNLAHWQFEHARKFGGEIGLILGERQWTNADLHLQARQFAAALGQFSVRPGDRVALALNNSAELFIASAGAAIAGAAIVVLGDRLSGELEKKIAHCEPVVTVFSSRVMEAARRWTHIPVRIAVGAECGTGFPRFDEIVSQHAPVDEPVELSAATLAQLCYTSGSTGDPKAVPYSHAALDNFLRVVAPAFKTPDPQVTLMGYPPTAFASRLVWMRFIANYRAVLLPEFDAESALQAIQRWGVTDLPLLPAMAEMLLACPDRHRYVRSSVNFVTMGGAHVPAALVSGVRELFGRARAKADQPRVAVHYGMTETGGGFATSFEGGDGVVGWITPGVEVRILDADGSAARSGEPGEIAVKAPFAPEGYWRDPAATAKVFRDGFVHTGDVGYFREDGQLCLVGRCKDMIIQGGTNIYPAELLNVVYPMTGVRECAVVGIPNRLLGEEVVVCVVREDAVPSEAQIRAECRRRLDPRKQPVKVLFFAALPKTDSGKIDFPKVRERVLQQSHKPSPGGRPAPPATVQGVCEAIESALRDILGEEASARPLDCQAPFGEIGLDSVGAVRLSSALSARFAIEVPPTLAYSCPTIDACAAWVRSELARAKETAPGASAAHEQRGSDREIAIVGLGVRLPGGVGTADELWDLLCEGRDTVCEIPPLRSITPGPTRPASFLADAAAFDAAFFRLASQGAELDPRHRHLLEVCWEALENSGSDPTSLPGDRVGLFLGMYGSDRYRTPNPLGAAPGMAAGYLCQFFDIRGPVVTVDTTCSSSLVAMHYAVESLHRRECDLAIVGGANLLSMQQVTAPTGEDGLQLLSADGRCRTFDRSASGFGQGEGCVLLILKRSTTAREAGDRILATVLGTAINHDGRSSSLTAPNPVAQASVIELALRDARLTKESVQYVEAHGTGTVLGDPIEVEGIARALGGVRRTPLAIGSIKTNIGHLEAAAGVAGVAKVALAISRRLLPASRHFDNPNPHIPWADIPVRVQVRAGEWPDPQHRLIAGISSFGMSGTNAHVIVGEAAPDNVQQASDAVAKEDGRWLLPLSARSPSALRSEALRWARQVERAEGTACRDIAYTASCRRAHLPFRLAISGSSGAEWAQQLRAYASRDVSRLCQQVTREPRKLALVFSGQGSQWSGMARGLFSRSFAFREALKRCAALIDPQLKLNLIEELEGGRLGETAVTQAALFAMQIALYRLWRSWGVEPAAVVGHSAGEIAAAHVSGLLTLEEAVELVCKRGQCCKEAPEGAMIAAAMREEDARVFCSRREGLSLAAINGPRSSVLSGTLDSIDSALVELKEQGVRAHRLAAGHAFHSPLMQASAVKLRSHLTDPEIRTPLVQLVSSMTGDRTDRMDASYWSQQLTRPVQFFSAMTTLLNDGCTAFLEVAPHPVLLTSMEEVFDDVGRSGKALCVGSLRRGAEEAEPLLASLAELHCSGVKIDWARRFKLRGRHVDLPAYPWEHKQYWLSATSPPQDPDRRGEPGSTESAVAAPSVGEVSDLFLEEVSKLTALAPEELQPDRTFEELGVDSLALLRLRAILAPCWSDNRDVPRIRLDTILGEVLRALQVGHAPAPNVPQARRGSPLRWLRREGSGPTHVFVHPVGGGIGCYRALARSLPSPVIAIESPWLWEAGMQPRRLEEVASSYLGYLEREGLPHPLVLGGWSFGGVTAYEMAVQLASRGSYVSRVVMIDSYVGSQLPLEIEHHGGDLLHLPDTAAEDRERMQGVRAANFEALRAYTPGRFEGPVVSVRAVPALGDPDSVWRDKAPRIRVHPIQTDHFSIMAEGLGAQLARVFVGAAVDAHPRVA